MSQLKTIAAGFETFEPKVTQSVKAICNVKHKKDLLARMNLHSRQSLAEGEPLGCRYLLRMLFDSCKTDSNKARQDALEDLYMLKCMGYSDLSASTTRFDEVASDVRAQFKPDNDLVSSLLQSKLAT